MTILIFGVLSLIVAVMASRFIKAVWLYFIVASFLPPALMIGAAALLRGGFEPFDEIAFVTLWLIAFAISVVVIAEKSLRTKRKADNSHRKLEGS